MSLNLGNDAVQTIRELRGSEQWSVICDSLLEASRKAMNIALEAPAGTRDDVIGYARALRDVYVAFVSSTSGQPINRIDKPGPVKK